MRHYLGLAAFICCAIFFSACNSLPDHARYIPKNAVAVISLDAKTLGKKVAWNVITGSKLFQEMQNEMSKGQSKGMNGLDEAGIDASNTFYLYVSSDKRYKTSNRITALIPLSNAGQWEAFVKKTFPAATVKQHGDRKEAVLTGKVFASWTGKLLVVMNALPNPQNYMPGNADSTAQQSAGNDETVMEAAMNEAFEAPKDNQLINDKRFAKLQHEGHDATAWINYDQLMSDYITPQMSQMTGGISLAKNLWQDAAAATGIDFDKGRIVEVGRFYASDSLRSICKEFGATNADKGMIDKLPTQNLDLLMAWHLAPNGLKDLLNKLNVLGLANIALSSQNMDVDYILNAFTGDMAITLNDFSLKKVSDSVSAAINISDSGKVSGNFNFGLKPSMNTLFVMEINKKENFNKLLQMAVDNGLANMGNNLYAMPISGTDSVFVMVSDKYAAISNKSANVAAFISGTYKGQKLRDEAAKEVYGHPFGAFIDIQQIGNMIDPGIGGTPNDSAAIAEAKKLISDVTSGGGEFRDGAFEARTNINFVNKDENSLLELMDFGMRIKNISAAGH